MRITLTGLGFWGKGVAFLSCFFLLSSCKESDDPLAHSSEEAVVITCGMVAHEYEACKKGVSRWMQKTGKKAVVVPAPNGSNERLTLFQQHLAAESPDIDIYQVDVVWPGLLARHFIDLYPYLSEKRKSQYLPQLLKNNTVAERLVALPWFLNVGFLYYRKDLLEKYGLPVPTTWEEVEKEARYILQLEKKQGNADLWGYVFQGKAYEGLTCNAIEWIASYPHGGSIVELDGHVSIYNKEAVYIVQKIADWIGVLSPPGVLNYEQEDCRGIFQLGKAVFMRNWPYAWVVLNNPESAVAGKVGITTLPKGGPKGHSSSVLGGWNLAVSKYSKRQKDAVDLVLFLTSEDELRRRAIEHGYYPPMQSLYLEEKIRSLSPVTGLMLDVLKSAVPRPAGQTGAKYSQVSAIFWNMVYETLAHKGSAEKNLKTVEKKLNFISKNGTRWIKKS